MSPGESFNSFERQNQLREGRSWGKSIANNKNDNIVKTGQKELERADDPDSVKWRESRQIDILYGSQCLPKFWWVISTFPKSERDVRTRGVVVCVIAGKDAIIVIRRIRVFERVAVIRSRVKFAIVAAIKAILKKCVLYVDNDISNFVYDIDRLLYF